MHVRAKGGEQGSCILQSSLFKLIYLYIDKNTLSLIQIIALKLHCGFSTGLASYHNYLAMWANHGRVGKPWLGFFWWFCGAASLNTFENHSLDPPLEDSYCTYFFRLLYKMSWMLYSSLNCYYIIRLIVIAELAFAYEKLATPLINRLEKHYVLTSSVLKDWQKKVLKVFEEWISIFFTNK